MQEQCVQDMEPADLQITPIRCSFEQTPQQTIVYKHSICLLFILKLTNRFNFDLNSIWLVCCISKLLQTVVNGP